MSQNPLPSPPIARKEPKETNLHGVAAHRRLRLAPRKRKSRSHRLSRRRERLRRSRDGAARRPARAALPGDAHPHEADRRFRSLPRRRLVVLHPHRGGHASTPSTAASAAAPSQARPTGHRSGEDSDPRRQPTRQGPRLFPSAPPTSPTTAAGSPTPPTPPASASTRCTSRILKPAKRCPAPRSSASAPSSGPPTIARFSTRSKTSSRSASSSYGAARSARSHSTDVLVYQDDDERFNLGAGRTRDGKFIVLESASHTTTESRVLPADKPNGRLHAHQPRAKTSTSTPSTTATASGSSAPTTAAATSASSPRPSPRPAASTGPSSFPTATTSCSKSRSLRQLLRCLRARRRPAPPAPLVLRRRRP